MNRNKKRIVMGCFVATLTAGTVLLTTATPSVMLNKGGAGSISIEDDEVLPVAGVTLALDKSLVTSEVSETPAPEAKEETHEEAPQEAQVQEATKEEAPAPEVKSPYADIAIAQVNNYVNIRNTPGESGEVLGKLYNNSAATIVAQEGDWYKITSGTVEGYVKAQYVVSGQDAEAIAKQVGHRIAKVTTQTLRVRDNVGLDAPVQTLVPMNEELDVKEELDGWVRVALDDDVEGYVSADYVEIRTEFVQAESIEEEKARLAEEERQRKEAEEAARKADEEAKAAAAKKKAKEEAAAAQAQAEAQSQAETIQNNISAAEVSGTRQAVINYALKFVGNPYKSGGTSLTNGADCSGFVQSVFRDCGISLGRSSRDQAAGGTEISVSDIQPGDLLFYSNGKRINHVALYIGNGQVVHASNPRSGIRISNYNYRTPCKAVRYL